MEISP